MEVKYKKTLVGVEGCYDNAIFCRIRVSFQRKLSEKEKSEVLSTLREQRNVPSRYTEIHNAVSEIGSSVKDYYLRKDMNVVTIGEENYLEMMLKFFSYKRFQSFLIANHLTAEEF